MDMTVELGEERKVLQSLRELIKDHLLPRLTNLEVEVKYLRQVCWPVCQAIREKSQIDDIENKKKFLEYATPTIEEIHTLLLEKQKIHRRLVELGLTPSRTDLIEQEMKKIFR